MKLTFRKVINLHLLTALFVTGLLATAMVGCGDDDDDKGTKDASMADSGKGGKGGADGGTAGKGGTGGSGGTGGTTVVAPTSPQECKVAIKRDSPADSDARTDCLCDKCFDVWIPCILDEGCKKLVRCSIDNGCINTSCATLKCSALISEYYSSLVYSGAVADCNKPVRCDLASEADSGTSDSGI